MSGGELAGRVALVTGGAGAGIGSATARRLAEEGAAVVVVDDHERRTREVAEALAKETGARVLGCVGDIADRARMDAVLAEVEEALGPVDVLVNNAAINVLAPLSRYETDDWDRVMAVDLDAAFYLIRRARPGMLERGQGSIVNITSVAAFLGNVQEGPYAAAKAGLHALTRSVAVEGGPRGVRCNAVATGIIESRFVQRYAEAMEPEKQRTPLRRFGRPEEVAELVAFLVSERSAFITGEVINISGGWYLRP
jgi:NAD(P)-dependent dehydrogenase (short-subunit alcohol dehydrogenase family)